MCDGNPSGFCVDYSVRYIVTSDSCPSGYTKSGDVCKKTETISCKAN